MIIINDSKMPLTSLCALAKLHPKVSFALIDSLSARLMQMPFVFGGGS